MSFGATTAKWITALAIIGVSVYAAFSDTFEVLSDPVAIRLMIENAGAAGPLIVVVSIAVAVVFSPIPSAPLTAIAGAAYGHFWGTAYALVGAQVGAMLAYYIARKLGRTPFGRMTAKIEVPKNLKSQNALTVGIFLARLVPAVSFDAISYLAGLSPITPVRFFLATLFGMLPMTFLFTHFGDELMIGDGDISGWLALLAGLGIIAFGAGWMNLRRGKAAAVTDDADTDEGKEAI